MDWATAEYVAQIRNLSPLLYQMGGRDALKEYGVPEEHRIYEHLPEFQPALPDTELEPASNSSEAPLEASGPLPLPTNSAKGI